MAEISIPGDEIEEAATNMQQVIDLFDSTSTDLPHLDHALGDEATVTAAAKDFKDRWDDGRTQLRDEGKKIIDTLKQVLQGFTDTDQQLADSIRADPSGSGANSGADAATPATGRTEAAAAPPDIATKEAP